MPTPQSSPFLSLPRELRDEIYKYSLPESQPSDVLIWPNASTKQNKHMASIRPPFASFPSICLASKTTYHEVIPLFLQTLNIVSEDSQTTKNLILWLSTFAHSTGFNSIRNLTITPFNPLATDRRAGPQHPALTHQTSLLSKCTSLRTLTLTFTRSFETTVNREMCLNRFELCSVGVADHRERSIAVAYYLEEIVALPKLEKLVLDFKALDEAFSWHIDDKINEWYVMRWKEERRNVLVELLEPSECYITGFMLFD
ncbi:hypothetical protein K505DRAFT_415299 [Melanomma pulvis-pyrius CBS 109.77]|uniref:F-box domain-containing protein n=1 Tax=Melanomma pulvis-pyrius CBS 109.77 TaxID=1314802 RepID=A0A6A6XLH8_9PLEO|nr:hypothetical protein K505DRAFT_415299 [Melanomma pulvis-pyrius CBS 109.77]